MIEEFKINHTMRISSTGQSFFSSFLYNYTVKNPAGFPGGKHFGQPFFPAIWSPIPFDSI